MQLCRVLHIWLWAALPAFAGQVLQVASSRTLAKISSSPGHVWKVNDTACVYRERKEMGCGLVVKSVGHLALVRFASPVGIEKGDDVKPSARQPAGVSALRVDKPNRRRRMELAAVVSLDTGLHYVFPGLRFVHALSDHFALGLQGSYFQVKDTDTSVSVPTGALALGFYSKGPFEGLWGQLALGAFFFSASSPTENERAISPGVMGTLGWRLRFRSGISLGAAAGAQYISLPVFNSITFSFSKLQPVVTADVAISF